MIDLNQKYEDLLEKYNSLQLILDDKTSELTNETQKALELSREIDRKQQKFKLTEIEYEKTLDELNAKIDDLTSQLQNRPADEIIFEIPKNQATLNQEQPDNSEKEIELDIDFPHLSSEVSVHVMWPQIEDLEKEIDMKNKE